MPLFTFGCANCGHRFEELVSSSSSKPEACPSCGNPALERELGSFAVGKTRSVPPSFCHHGNGGSGCGQCPMAG